jgi:hypothetical protein
MKKLLLLCITFALMSFAFADTFIIGTGTSASGLYPIYGYYDYSWSKQIYTAAEINAAGLNEAEDITGLGLYVGNTPANFVMANQNIYMRHTSLTGFSTATDETGTGYPNNAGFTHVFQGTLTFNGGGWHYITFDTSFGWNNTDNIEILWENQCNNGLTGYPTFRYTSTSPDYKNVYKYQNDSFPAVSGTRSTSRPNITIVTPQTDPPNPAILGYPADGGWAFLDASLSWSDGGGMPEGYDVYFGTTNPPPLVSDDQTATNYTPTLAANMTYYWKVEPYNANGPAVGCPVWSFQTPTANQLAESFDDTTFPPLGWANPGSWSRSTTTPYYGAANTYKSASTTAALLSTPLLDCSAATTLDFAYRTSSTTGYGRMQVKYSPDRVTWTPIGDEIVMPTTTTWNTASVDISALSGTRLNYYLGFEVYTTTSTSSIYLDHVFGPVLAAVAPGPVTLTAPGDAATGVSQFPSFTWTGPTTGGIPTGFRIYCDTNIDPTTQIGDVTGLTYTATTALNYNTLYYWKVVAYNGAGASIGNTVWSFTTRDDPTIYTLPWLEDFGTTGTTFPPTEWSRWSGLLTADPVPLTSVSGYWVQDDWHNLVTTPANKSARLNIYTTSYKYWLMTPPIQIPGNGYQLEFDIALTDYAANAPITSDPNGTTGVDDKFAVLISDGGSWSTANVMRLWDNAGSPYVYNDIPYDGTHITLSLDGYAGIKYVAFYGESTVSNADNDFFVDNVFVRQTPAGLPDHVTLNNPPDGSADLDPANVVLSWTPALSGGTPDYFGVYVGEDPLDPGLGYYGEYYYETTDNFLDLSAQTDITIGYSSTWYWAVLPYNGTPPQSPDPNDPAFMIWQFTTLPDPTITVLPHQENFDTVTPPDLPWGWSAVVDASTTAAYVNTYASTTYAYSAPNMARLYNSTDVAANLLLITPPLTTPLNSIKTRFYARSSTAGETLLVGTWNPTTEVFTQVGSVTGLTTTHTQYVVTLDSYVGTDTHIAFKHGVGTSSRTIYLDNVEFIEMVDNDLAAQTLAGPNYGLVGNQLDYTITVKNEGLLAQNSYMVKLMSVDTRTELASVTINTPIDPGATAQHVVPWTPTLDGIYDIYGKVVLAGDQTPANDETSTKTVYVAPADIDILAIGDPETTTSANTLPTNVYYKNGVTEVLYFPDEMHLTSGTIAALIYKNNFTQALPGLAFKIWMGTTTETDLSGGWLPSAGLTLVFDGTLDLPIGINEVVVPLQTPFAYTGGNLVIRWNRVMDTVYYNSTNVWYYTDTAATHASRARYLQSDSTTYDPLAPSAAGTLLSRVPNTWLVVDNAVLETAAILSGHVYKAGTMPQEPVEGVTVTLTERVATTTDANGFYEFMFWQAGTYDATYTKFAYYDQTVTGLSVTMGNTTTQDINLVAMPRVAVTGDVYANDAPGGLVDATVTITGPETHSVTTGPTGHFSIPDVLGSNTGINYTLMVEKQGYTSYSGNFNVFELPVYAGTVTLTEIAWPAYNLEATHSGDNAQLVWDPAGAPDYYFNDFETDNGGWVSSGYGDWEWGAYNVANWVDPDTYVDTPPTAAHSGTKMWGTVLEASYSNCAAWSYLRQTFDLTPYPNPVLKIWHYMDGYNTWDYGLIKVNGTTVWGSSAQAVFMPWQELTVDLSAYGSLTNAEISFEWYATSVVAYAGWYIDDLYVGPATTRNGNLFSTRDRSFQNYDVYRFPTADEGNPVVWTQLENAWATTTYTDPGFAALPGGTYKWAVVANYTGTLESAAEISNSLGRVYDPQDIAATKVGNNVQLDWTAEPGAAFYKVYAASDPYGTFTYLGYSATNQFVVVAPAEAMKFYKVTAVADETMPSPAPAK